MRNDCIQSVTDAIGRTLNQKEIDNIEERVRRAFPLARQNLLAQGIAPTSRTMLEEASRIAASSLDADAELKQLRVAKAIQAHDNIAHYLSNWKTPAEQLDAIRRLLVFDGDARNKALSVESQSISIRDEALGAMREVFEASNAKFFGMIENMNGIRMIVREMLGENTGNPEAKAAAKLWMEWTERLRQRMNRTGGDIGKLEDWGLPHHHSQIKVAKAGLDAWLSDIMPMLRRDRYVNEDGSLMNDEQLRGVLSEAYKTISQGGINKIEPGKFNGNGIIADYGSSQRSIHFKDADSWVAYQIKYGEKGFYDVMAGHIDSLARRIALAEAFGPNAQHTYEYFRDTLLKQAVDAEPTKLGKITERVVKLDGYYNQVAGRTLPVASERLAATFDSVRQWLTASRLGSAFISSIPDEAVMHLTAVVNKLPEMQLFRNELATLNPANKAEKRLAERAGLGVEAFIHELNRFGQEGLGRSFSSKMATATIRASGLSAITAARKRAFGVTMMDSIGHLVQTKSFDELESSDLKILKSKGIKKEDWNVWSLAKPENWEGRNTTVLTPESIRRIPDSEIKRVFGNNANIESIKDRAVTRLLGSVLEEVDMAIVTPGAAERAITGAGIQRGTWKGELTRSFFLFKSFPIAMIHRHLNRGWNGMDTAGGKAGYIAALIAGTTLMGAAAVQINEILKGNDPKNMNIFDDPKMAFKFWGQSLLKGGSLGIYGDFLFNETTSHGSSFTQALVGPVVGLAEDMMNLSTFNVLQYLRGEDTNFGAELIKQVKSNTPGASLWYAKGALDHLIFHELQEMASPGYLARMRRRLQKEHGQSQWWVSGEATPDRAPDIGAAVGMD